LPSSRPIRPWRRFCATVPTADAANERDHPAVNPPSRIKV
jgi:hypothetical protein